MLPIKHIALCDVNKIQNIRVVLWAFSIRLNIKGLLISWLWAKESQALQAWNSDFPAMKIPETSHLSLRIPYYTLICKIIWHLYLPYFSSVRNAQQCNISQNQNVHAVTQGHRVICYFVLLTYTYNLHLTFQIRHEAQILTSITLLLNYIYYIIYYNI